jgi:hypothetical protein
MLFGKKSPLPPPEIPEFQGVNRKKKLNNDFLLIFKILPTFNSL